MTFLRRKGKTILALALAMLIFLMPLSVYAQEADDVSLSAMTETEEAQRTEEAAENETADSGSLDEAFDAWMDTVADEDACEESCVVGTDETRGTVVEILDTTEQTEVVTEGGIEEASEDPVLEESTDDAGIEAMASSSQVPIYRLYYPGNGEHLYTTDVNEKNTLYNNYGWGYEGIAWYASSSGTPVYRLYHPGLGNHLYTTDTNEVKVLTSKHGWKKDNNGKALSYSSGSVPIYRVYNKAQSGMHHLTTDVNEYKTLPKYGWKQEGVKIYAQKIGSPITTTYSTKTNLANAKKAYKTLVNQNKTITYYGSVYNQGYYLHDLNSDGIPELLLKLGCCNANYNGVAYTYDTTKQKAVKVGTFPAARTTLYYGNKSKSSGPIRADWYYLYTDQYVQYKISLSGTTLNVSKVIEKTIKSDSEIPSNYGKLTLYSTTNLSPLN